MLVTPEAHVPSENVVKKKTAIRDFVVYGQAPEKARKQYIATVKAHSREEAIEKISLRFPTVTNWAAAPKTKDFDTKPKKIG